MKGGLREQPRKFNFYTCPAEGSLTPQSQNLHLPEKDLEGRKRGCVLLAQDLITNVWAYLIFTKPLQDRCRFHPYFTNKKAETQSG